MPDLPAITLTAAQFNRVKNVIPGATNADKFAAYQQMVKDMLRQLVIDADMFVARRAAEAAIAAASEAAQTNPDNPTNPTNNP